MRFTNAVGLATERVAEIIVVVPPSTGTITGTLTQGEDPPRPQAGRTVTLYDAAGKPVLVTTTDDAGAFRFPAVKPGVYTVNATKPEDYGAKASGRATVVAGKTTEVPLALKR